MTQANSPAAALDERVLEIRTYRIPNGQRDEFGRRMSAVAPMLRRHGLDLVFHGPSIDNVDHYALLRSYASLEQLQQQEREFYQGDQWRSGPREGILELIDTYHTVALRSTPAAVRTLAQSLGQ